MPDEDKKEQSKIASVNIPYNPEVDISALVSRLIIESSTITETISTNTCTIAISGAPKSKKRMLNISPAVPIETTDDAKLLAVIEITQPAAIRSISTARRPGLSIIFL
jgi:hypothetical protein